MIGWLLTTESILKIHILEVLDLSHSPAGRTTCLIFKNQQAVLISFRYFEINKKQSVHHGSFLLPELLRNAILEGENNKGKRDSIVVYMQNGQDTIFKNIMPKA